MKNECIGAKLIKDLMYIRLTFVYYLFQIIFYPLQETISTNALSVMQLNVHCKIIFFIIQAKSKWI